MRTTRTYVILPVSATAFEEIERKLREAGYDHAFQPYEGAHDLVIDMHGLALEKERE